MATKNKNKRKTKPPGGKAKRVRSKPLSSPATNGSTALAVLSPDRLKELYSTMVKCRMLQEKAQALGAARGLSHPDRTTRNREAVLVGAAAHLVAEDSITMPHSGFLASFIRGTSAKLIFAKLGAKGKAAGSRAAGKTRRGSPARLSMAAAMTLAHAVREKAKVALVFSGDDAAALAFIHDGLALAAKHKLPLVCLIECSSASPAIAEAAPRQNGAAQASDAPHAPKITVDGVDVVAIFRVAQEAVRRARAGHGPSLVECVMPEENSNHAAASDPIAFMEHYLRRRDLWSDEWQRKTMQDFSRELDEAASVEPPSIAERPFDHVYSLDAESSRPSPAAWLLGRTGPSGA
jgi:TPP-dependent pyruvate/acetoin dehydrogenase alpha subunit